MDATIAGLDMWPFGAWGSGVKASYGFRFIPGCGVVTETTRELVASSRCCHVRNERIEFVRNLRRFSGVMDNDGLIVLLVRAV